MSIVFPHNIFANLLFQVLPAPLQKQVEFKPSALLAKTLAERKAAIALMPALDLIHHTDFFVSSRFGISFEGFLSNDYFYFPPNQRSIKQMSITGDVSGTEAVLTKILLQELYDEDIEISIKQNPTLPITENMLIAGDLNLQNNMFITGISYSEEVIDLLSLPFVQYVIAAKDEHILSQFERQIEHIENEIYAEVERDDWEFRLDEAGKDFFRENITHVIYEFDDEDREGLLQLTQMPYLHGMTDDIFDVKFTMQKQ